MDKVLVDSEIGTGLDPGGIVVSGRANPKTVKGATHGQNTHLNTKTKLAENTPKTASLRRQDTPSKMMPHNTALTSFVTYKVEYILKDLLETKLKNVKYAPNKCSDLVQQLCLDIKAKTKDLNFDRFKLVTQVYLGQDSEQSVQVTSRCLWNPLSDNFAAATYRNSSIYAIAIVYGVYLD